MSLAWKWERDLEIDGGWRDPMVAPHHLTPWSKPWPKEVAAVGLALAIARGQAGPLLLLSASLIGFLYVAALEIRELKTK